MLAAGNVDFSNYKIFKEFRKNVAECDGQMKNLIDCKDDIIFAWDKKERKLLTQNLKILRQEDPVYQELYPTQSPVIDINSIRVNETLSKCILWGPRGIVAIDIPQRWGSQGAFQGGKDNVLVKCKTVEEKYFAARDVVVIQIRFHPGAPQDNVIFVLTSENSIRQHYLPIAGREGDDAEPVFIRSWNLGDRPFKLSGKMSFLASLGETAVDFDFAMPTLECESQSQWITEEAAPDDDTALEKVSWSILVLMGNGDMWILKTSLAKNSWGTLEGAVPIYPPADDNYGFDACSILVMPTLPNIVVMATSSGTIYHSVLLNTIKDESSSPDEPSYGLYVLESVELELGLQLGEDDVPYTCLIALHRVPDSRWKYFCVHNTGIHAVMIGFALQLENFMEGKSAEGFVLPDTVSTVEYLLCTRTNTTPACPLFGFALVKSWNLMLLALSTGEVCSLPLKKVDFFVEKDRETEKIVGEEWTPIKKLLKGPFDSHIQNLLKRNVSQPLLRLDKSSEMSVQERLDLVTRTTTILRQEYFAKFEAVRDEIEQRAATLRALKQLQLKELKEIDEEKLPELQKTTARLSQKFEEIKEKHDKMLKRIEAVVMAVRKVKPTESLAEKKMKNEVIALESRVGDYEKSIKKLKDTLDYQKFEKCQHKMEMKKMYLGSDQVSTIKTHLEKCSAEIVDLVNTVNELAEQI